MASQEEEFSRPQDVAIRLHRTIRALAKAFCLKELFHGAPLRLASVVAVEVPSALSTWLTRPTPELKHPPTLLYSCWA